MAQITEDYVSFEVAKLLKEKGFNGLCYAYYDCFTTDNFHSGCEPTDFNSIDTRIRKIVSAPTLQMVMKWLREVHNVYIEVSLSCDREDKNAKIFDVSIFNIQNQRYKKLCSIQGYENACKIAIKYCLENLI